MDRLRMEHINSLPQPFMVRLCGSKDWWPVYDIEVQVAWLRIDVCGKLQVCSFAEVMEIADETGAKHDPEDWWHEERP